MKSNSISLIACEATGRWAAALRRELPRGVSLVETRSLSEMWQRLADCPNAVVVLEATPEKIEPTLAALLRIGREFPQALSMVLADRTLLAWEDAVREAGAAHFINSPRRLPEMGEIVRRRMQSFSESALDAGGEDQAIEQRIFATLPWAE